MTWPPPALPPLVQKIQHHSIFLHLLVICGAILMACSMIIGLAFLVPVTVKIMQAVFWFAWRLW